MIHDSLANAGAFLNGPGGGGTNPLDVIGNAMDEAQRRHDAAVARTAATARAIVNASAGGGGPSVGFASLANQAAAQRAAADAQKAAADALKDRIDAIREEAKARQDALRDSIDGFQKEHDAAIRTIQDEQDARGAAHDKAIRAIEDEQRATDEAFSARDRVRSDEIDALREQIRGTEELGNLEQRRQDIADAEATTAHERGVQVFRERNETEEQYQRRVFEQQRRIKDAETKLSDTKKALAKDEARAQIEERIRAIETVAAADRRALEDYKQASEDRLRAIRDEMDLEKSQADTRIQQLRDEEAAVRDRMTTIIDTIQKETDAQVKELETRLKAIQTFSGGVVAAYGAQVVAAQAARDAAREAAAAQAAVLAHPYSPPSTTTGAGSHGPIIDSPPGPLFPFDLGPAAAPTDHDYPHTMRFSEPARIIGRSGTDYGTLAARGAEDVTFGGVGGRRSAGDGGVASTVNVYGLGLDEAARIVARHVERNLERRAGAIARAGSWGRR